MTTSYKVERAIIMAAGKGTRLYPVTESTPKPLVMVNGVRMIETAINALYANSIKEIHVVTGYMKEKFSVLHEKYPDIDLIENPYYDSCNNISSLYVAREYLKNVLIMDGDQLVYHPSILSPEFKRSGYNCVWTDGQTNEWLLTVKNGVVTACSRNGGKDGWQLFSISRWNAEDGARLRHHLEVEFEEKKNRQIYWDDIALFCYPEEYKLGIREMQFDDVVEVDNFSELVALDASYSSFN